MLSQKCWLVSWPGFSFNSRVKEVRSYHFAIPSLVVGANSIGPFADRGSRLSPAFATADRPMIPHRDELLALARSVPNCIFGTVSGAHLYGFESPDSDVDLRGAFVWPLRTKLGLRTPRETFDRILDERGLELDFVAHDVQKCVHYAGFFASRRALLAREGATVKHLLYAYRATLTGIVALQSGRIDAHLPSLLVERPAAGVEDLIARKRAGAEQSALAPGETEAHAAALEALERELEEAHAASALPEAPSHHDALDEFLIRVREAHR